MIRKHRKKIFLVILLAMVLAWFEYIRGNAALTFYAGQCLLYLFVLCGVIYTIRDLVLQAKKSKKESS